MGPSFCVDLCFLFKFYLQFHMVYCQRFTLYPVVFTLCVDYQYFYSTFQEFFEIWTWIRFHLKMIDPKYSNLSHWITETDVDSFACWSASNDHVYIKSLTFSSLYLIVFV